MELIRFAELKAQPWRSAGGVITEVRSRPGAADGTGPGWDWLVSIGELSKACGLPAHPGMDRVLTVIDGELLVLSVDGAEHPLEKYRAFRFSGDAEAAAALPTGDVRALDVLTRRGGFKGYTSIIELSKKRPHPVFGGQLGILLQGQATAAPGPGGQDAAAEGTADTADADRIELARYDTVVGSDTASPEILGRGFLAVVSIDADPAGSA